MSQDAGRTRREGLGELAEDAVGFGASELRLTRDLILRPRAVMDAYDAHGSTAGGLYPKPLRYWLTFNGLYFLLMALTGMWERSLRRTAATDEQFATLAEVAGKTSAEFSADLEQWMSLVMLPLYGLFFGGGMFILIRRWNPGDDRQDFRQTFTYLNLYTIWSVPLGLFSMGVLRPDQALLTLPGTLALMAGAYALLGKGRWWRTRQGAWLKGAALLATAVVALIPLSVLAGIIAVAAAMFLP